MNGWVVLLIVLAVLFLIGRLKVGVAAQFAEDGLTVRARLGPLRIKVFPLPKREKKEKPKKEKKKKPPKEPKEGEKAPKPKGGALELAKTFLPLALEAAGCFWKKLVVDELELLLTVGSDDPADAALLYGQANAALGALWGPLTQAFHVVDGHAHVYLDFDAKGMTLYGMAALSLRIGQILWLGIYFGVKALCRFLRFKRNQKAKQTKRKAV